MSSGVSLAFDSKDGYALLFGGAMTSGVQVSNATWRFHRGAWSNITTAIAPPARVGAMMAYDAKDGYAVLFGGFSYSPAHALQARSDTWTFSGGRWTNVTPAIPSATNVPTGRWFGGMAYDPPCGCVVMFGGTYYPETWEFHGGNWTNVTTARSPPGRLDCRMTYDAKDGYLVLFGGEGPRSNDLNDTWRWLHGSWKNLTAPVAPSARVGEALAFDPKTGTVILFGGGLLRSSSVFSDTWSFSGGVWTQVTPAAAPPPRDLAGFTYDHEGRELVLYGGTTSGFAPLDDTWRYR